MHNLNTYGSGRWIQYSKRINGGCPICSGYHTRCAQSPEGIHHCIGVGHGERVPGWRNIGKNESSLGCSMWVPGDPWVAWTDEEKKAWGRKQHQQREREEKERRDRQAQAKTPTAIDREYETAYQRNPISDRHIAEFERRGLSRADIKCIGAYTINLQLILPIRNLEGLRVGAQIRIDGQKGYTWDRAGRNRTKNHDELPIAVWGNRENPNRILFCEGTTFKPYIASLRFPGDLVIGVSGGQFSGGQKQIREVLAKYPNADLVLLPDAGATLNRNVQSAYIGLFEIVGDRGISIAWWNQFIKPDGDIDEIDIATTEIKYLELDRYKSMAEDGCAYAYWNGIDDRKAVKRDEKYLTALDPIERSTINFVSSGVGTGKTHQLPALIEQWEKYNPDGRTIIIGYRNALLDQQSAILGIDSYKTGHGLEYLAIENNRRIAFTADSILKLQLSDIPAGSLIILDEVEAVLKHCSIAGTFGARAAQIQAHIANIIDRVLVSGGAVIALEDTITRLSVQGLNDLTGNKYQNNLTINRYSRFKWDVAIGHADPDRFMELLIVRLMMGERIQLSTTSQVFGEAIERMVTARVPELADKIQRVDAKTVLEKKDLMSDPIGFLRANETRLLILSPTVESGFSIDDKGIDPLFDRVLLYAVHLDTRTQLQMLARYRSDCPRDIYVCKRGVEFSGELGRCAKKLLKKQRTIANTTALEQGYGRIENNNIGEIWNRLESEFIARDAICAKYLYQFLRKELIEDGHSISIVDWGSECDRVLAQYGIDGLGDVRAEYKDIKTEIDKELAAALYDATESARKMSLDDAERILRSTNSSYTSKIVARMCKLMHRLPGINIEKDFIYDCTIKDRGQYLNQLELSYLIAHPEIANALDREIFAKQVEGPHVIYSRTPRNRQKVRLFLPIATAIEDLVSGREYWDGDKAAEAIANYARSKSYDFWMLFGINPRHLTKDTNGRRVNTDVAIVNKLLAKLGYKAKRVRQAGTGKERVSIYAIVNASCQYRATAYEAFNTKYKQAIERASAIELVKHTISSNTNPVLENVCLDSDRIQNLPPPLIEMAPKPEPTPQLDTQDLSEVVKDLKRGIFNQHYRTLAYEKYSSEQINAAIQLLPDNQKRLFLPA